MTRYRVTQYDGMERIHSKDYRFKVWARFIAWIYQGQSWPLGLTHFTTTLEEI